MMQQLILLGTFFVLPVYLQVVLGLDAFETGKRLFPMSVTMFIAALAGPAAGGRLRSQARRAGRASWRSRCVGAAARHDRRRARTSTAFAIALALFGVGAGLLLSQLGNVIMSSVDPTQDQRGGRPAGDRAEPRRVARHGADRRRPDRSADQRLQSRAWSENPAVSPAVREQVAARRREGHPGRAGRPTSSRPRATQGVPADEAQALADDYGDAQLQGLKRAIGAVGVIRPALALVHARAAGARPTPRDRTGGELACPSGALSARACIRCACHRLARAPRSG